MRTVKASLDLPPVNKNLRWKISATLMAPAQVPTTKDFSAYTSFDLNGTKYHRFSPRTYLIIEPVDYSKNDTSYFDKTLYLDAMGVFKFTEILQKFRDNFSTSGLFYYQNGALKLDTEIAKPFIESWSVYNKAVKLSYAVVRDPENLNDEYEGVVIFVNDYSYAITVTSTEISYMVDTLRSINMATIGFDLLRAAMRK